MALTQVIEWVENFTDRCFKMPELKQQAENLGIDPADMDKTQLIRAIQQAEGNTPCFATADGHCEQTECSFNKDCLKSEN